MESFGESLLKMMMDVNRECHKNPENTKIDYFADTAFFVMICFFNVLHSVKRIF